MYGYRYMCIYLKYAYVCRRLHAENALYDEQMLSIISCLNNADFYHFVTYRHKSFPRMWKQVFLYSKILLS